ncbi:MAG: hypothetical protein Q9184_008441, partial [Pyrenodesmia sp. 2 TL-2023]
MAGIYKRSLLDNQKERYPQIRLLELLPGTSGFPIRCRLRYEDLNPRSTVLGFQALSYCWGNSSERKSIIIDNATLLTVTTSLYLALHYIRDISKPKLLWVDAVCINQKDTEEKNQQVALMRRIYSAASAVLIWLGEPSHDSHAAFELIPEILRAKRLDEASGIQNGDLWDLSKDHWGLPWTTDPVWYPLFALLRRPWFKRAWIIQELAVSTNATVLCGYDKVSWTEFGEAYAYLAASGVMMTYVPVALVNFSILDHARHLVKQATPQPALHVLMRHRQALASDPRDKIFAFGGLIAADHNVSSCRKPEYGRHAASIFKTFAVETLKNDRALKILSVPRVQEHSSVGQLPSWVPDWSVSDQAASLQSWEIDEKTKGLIRPDFAATGSSKCTPLFNQDFTRLGLRGAIVDRILLAAPEIANPADRDSLFETNIPNLVIQGQRILKEWETMSNRRIPWTKYPTGENIRDVYWQTLMAGTIFVSHEVTRLQFDNWDYVSTLFRILQIFCLDRVWFFK